MTTDQAKARLAHFLSDAAPQISVHRHPHELQDTADWFEKLAEHFTDLFHAVAFDASQHVSQINPTYIRSVLSDAFGDADVPGDLRSEAENILEDQREEQLEHS